LAMFTGEVECMERLLCGRNVEPIWLCVREKEVNDVHGER
jgi:hypothetical protein